MRTDIEELNSPSHVNTPPNDINSLTPKWVSPITKPIECSPYPIFHAGPCCCRQFSIASPDLPYVYDKKPSLQKASIQAASGGGPTCN